MKNLDVETARQITLKAMNWMPDEAPTTAEEAAQHEFFRRAVSAVLEGIRTERERLAQWIVDETHSMLCRGTALELQEAILQAGCWEP
jgi:hypothetical protein